MLNCRAEMGRPSMSILFSIPTCPHSQRPGPYHTAQAVVNERVDYKTLHAEMIAALETQDKWVAVLCCCAVCMPDGRTHMQEPGCRALPLQARVAHGVLLLCWLRRWPVGESQQQAAPLHRPVEQEELSAGGHAAGEGRAAGGSADAAAGKSERHWVAGDTPVAACAWQHVWQGVSYKSYQRKRDHTVPGTPPDKPQRRAIPSAPFVTPVQQEQADAARKVEELQVMHAVLLFVGTLSCGL